MSRPWNRMAPLTGVALVVLLILSQVLLGNEPGGNASAGQVVAFYNAHRGGIQVSAYLTGLALLFGLFFYGYLSDHIRRAENSARLAIAAFGGAVLFAVGGALGAGTQFALADIPGRLSPAAAQALNLLQEDVSVFFIAAGAAGLLIASGLAILRGRQLPAWVGWLGLVLGIASLVPIRNIGAPLAGIWTLVASILLCLRAARHASALEPEASDPVPSITR
jgi:hypothetical protein